MTRLLPYLKCFKGFPWLLEQRSKSYITLYGQVPVFPEPYVPISVLRQVHSMFLNPLIPTFTSVLLFLELSCPSPTSPLFFLGLSPIFNSQGTFLCLSEWERSSPDKGYLNTMDLSFLARITALILCPFWVVMWYLSPSLDCELPEMNGQSHCVCCCSLSTWTIGNAQKYLLKEGNRCSSS